MVGVSPRVQLTIDGHRARGADGELITGRRLRAGQWLKSREV